MRKETAAIKPLGHRESAATNRKNLTRKNALKQLRAALVFENNYTTVIIFIII